MLWTIDKLLISLNTDYVLENPVNSISSIVNKKTIIATIGLIVLAAGTTLAFYLVGQKQIFQPSAGGPSPSAPGPVSLPETSFTLAAGKTSFSVNEVIKISVKVRSDIDAANLFAAKLRFPKDLLEVRSIESSQKPLACGQIITRACYGVKPMICRDFPTPCDVPEGWVIESSQNVRGEATVSAGQIAWPSRIPPPYFIQDWVEKLYDNQSGVVSLIGSVFHPGFKTAPGGADGLMAEIYFAAKGSGIVNITFDETAAIYRNSDNTNILTTKREMVLKIESLPTLSPKVLK